MSPIGLDTFQSDSFATIHCNGSYFISGFGSGKYQSCIFILIISNHLLLAHNYLKHFLFYHIMHCII